ILNSKKKLKNKKITITSGGTIEEIDTVRYISNYSSGKMGASLAKKACDMGAEVTLITTKDFNNTDYPQIKILKVKSALEMQKEVEKAFKKTDVLIMAAAVADYRAKNIADHKMKKTSKNTLSIELIKNPDILKEICEKKTKKQIVIGFCAESENLLKNAKEKISKKGCDYLIANDISRKDIGFSSDYNEIHILDKNGNIEKIDKATKDEIAFKILEKICK
ncbi:MAG: bifunctional phosphopantothenoylcysteine decarboxylase/phosphopantothenate--cysteine ligase CoaBC, partial [bacterium]|nr:bifunctional phosphopantothenoylcysteine decarboxylase/phosphopantothenate--cysteine ligase CoaBC [bacterium]